MKGKIAVAVAILFMIVAISYSEAQDLNTISVEPRQKTVGVGQTFNLFINITPAEPISSAICGISFDPNILQVVNIENGGLFFGSGDLWMASPADNENGTIEFIFGASDDLKTTPGSLAVITFQAIAQGTSYVNIENVVIHGSTNNNILNGTVIVAGGGDYTPPDIQLIEYPSATIEYRDVYFEWTATDDVSPEENITFSYMLDGYDADWSSWSYTKQASYFNLLAGDYTFKVRAKDDAGNIGLLTYSFSIIDTTPPEISNVVVWPSMQAVNGIVNISCIINDLFGIDEAKAIITYPDATVHEFDLLHNSKYYFSQSYSMVGTYEFYIYAKDVNGNEATSAAKQFEIVEGDFIPPHISDVAVNPSIQDVGRNLTISATVTDNVAVADVFLNITYPDGSYENFSIFQNRTGDVFYCIKSFTMLGTYEFYIYAIDVAGNGNVSSSQSFEIDDISPPTIENVTATPSTQNVGDEVNISATVTDNVAVADVFLNITYPDGSHKNFSIFQNRTGDIFYCIKSFTMLGTYEFYIYAIDNSSHANRSDVFSFKIEDMTPPHVEIEYPKGGEVVGGIITIKWNATDLGGVAGVTIKYSPNNGQTWHNIVENTENNGEYVWNATGLEDGNDYLIQVVAIDEAGNEGKDFSDKFTIDNTKPSLNIDKPITGKLYIFDKEILPLIGKKAVIIGKITIVAVASDTTSSISKVEFYIDGSLKKTDNSTPYEWQWDERTVGKHTIKVIAYDEAGNKETKEIEVFVINPL